MEIVNELNHFRNREHILNKEDNFMIRAPSGVGCDELPNVNL